MTSMPSITKEANFYFAPILFHVLGTDKNDTYFPQE